MLEGLLEDERAIGPTKELTSALERGREYLLERRLLPLEDPHADILDFDLDEREGHPSRWNTLRALRVRAGTGRVSDLRFGALCQSIYH